MVASFGSNAAVITGASAGKFRLNSTSEVCLASPIVAGGIVSVSNRSPTALPMPSTADTINVWPEELTTLPCSLSTNAPLRENISVCPSADFKGKKPSPDIARSRVLDENSILPWLNSWRMPVTATPWPTVPAEFCSGLLAKISPKDACDFLKPVVPTLAMLLLVTASSVLAARNPVNEVKKDIFVFVLCYCAMRLTFSSGMGSPPASSK